MKRLGIKPEMEIFDLSMINNAVGLQEKGLAEAPLHFNFVMGLKGAIPASIENLGSFTEHAAGRLHLDSQRRGRGSTAHERPCHPDGRPRAGGAGRQYIPVTGRIGHQ